MRVGHINLAKSFNGTGEHFVTLIEALDRQGVEQYIIVRNDSLAKRIQIYDKVTVGPTTSAAVVAYCLMPRVDVIHAHDERSAQAGLLLTLTRSIPFVLTRRLPTLPAASPVMRSIYERATGIICTTDAGARAAAKMGSALQIDVIRDISRASGEGAGMIGNRVAAEHLRVYHRAAENSEVPAFLL